MAITGGGLREVFETILPGDALMAAVRAAGLQERERKLDALALLRAMIISASLLTSKALVVAVILAPLVARSHDDSSDADRRTTFQGRGGEVIELSVASGSPEAKARVGSRVVALRIVGTSMQKLRGADQVARVSERTFPQGPQWVAFALIRYPSREGNPTGYCGAGAEDYLTVLAFDDQEVKVMDRLLVQSCLENIVLDSDQGDELREVLEAGAISVDPAGSAVHVRWMSHPRFGEGEKTIVIRGTHLTVE